MELYQDFIRDAKARVLGTIGILNVLVKAVADAALPRIKDAEIVGRDKTLSTLADKLERSPTEKLPSIHDVAGVRIVANISVVEQRSLAGTISNHFEKHVDCSRPPLLIDRISDPRHGYRALHLIVWPSGRPVEIQVRTSLQHSWAQYMEVMGDRWGREARYGLPIAGPDEQEKGRRANLVEGMKKLAETIALYEERSAPIALLHLKVSEQQLADSGLDPQLLAQGRKLAEENQQIFAETEAQLYAVLRSMSSAIHSDHKQSAP
jgi:ppGpp synthetase/RelA/SpoT-type nucleotidyltranferase